MGVGKEERGLVDLGCVACNQCMFEGGRVCI